MTELREPPGSWTGLRDQLAQAVGRPRRSPPLPLGNRDDPDEELLFILLTLLTRSRTAIEGVLARLLERYGSPPWGRLATARRRDLVRILHPVGLVNRRADQFRALGRSIRDRHGGTLRGLHAHPDEVLLAALEDLPGVGRKSARCVAAYAYGRDMLAVDVHVLRVLKRLDLVDLDARWHRIDELTNSTVPRRLRYSLHVQLVEFGRTVCTTRAPRCDACPLATWCPSAGSAAEDRATYVVELRRRPDIRTR